MLRLQDESWIAQAEAYCWSWKPATDGWIVADGQGRTIVRGQLKPRFVLADGSSDPAFEGATVQVEVAGNRLLQRWTLGDSHVEQVWTFHADHFAVAPLRARSPNAPQWAQVEQLCDLSSHYALLPGLSMSASVSPVVDLHSKWKVTTTLGAGAMRGPGLAQQWGLPAHWFAVYDTAARWNAAGARGRESDALCVGLASLPDGDFWVRTGDRCLTPLLNVRSDLWNFFSADETITTGLDLLFFVGRDFEQAPRAWYRHLAAQGLRAGSAFAPSGRPRDVSRWTLFNTWGSQVAEPIQPEELDQTRLEAYLDGLDASGMNVSLFVIDDKWEGAYGVLRHDEVRLPTFDALLDRVRASGRGVGLWAAFLRCEDPARVGLTEKHLMKDRDGNVLWFQHQTARYGLYDITHPEVVPVLTALARGFVERYRPDLIKFDFGYELPILDVSTPFDARYRGEKLLRRGLEVLLGAMKSVNPDLVVMYYGLSPLVAPYFDLHSLDDMVYCPRDYDVEGNRRLTLASLLGEVAMPVSSSTGYDWQSATDLWFDAAALGAPGSLLPFGSDEAGGGPSDAAVAVFNGVAAVARPSPHFSAFTVGGHPHGGHRALTTASWRRTEQGKTVLLALRPGTTVPELTFEGQLVIASLDGLDLSLSRHLGIVVWTSGSIHWPCPGRTRWSMTTHRLKARSRSETVVAEEGAFSLEWICDPSSPVEWRELRVLGG